MGYNLRISEICIIPIEVNFKKFLSIVHKILIYNSIWKLNALSTEALHIFHDRNIQIHVNKILPAN